MWMSLARSFTPWKKSALTQRMIGASSSESRMSLELVFVDGFVVGLELAAAVLVRS